MRPIHYAVVHQSLTIILHVLNYGNNLYYDGMYLNILKSVTSIIQ
jgi:hypothetical protein